MPIYNYQCRICGHEFEKQQLSGLRDIASCPECCCVSDKKMSVFNFSFGWTLDDRSRFIKGYPDKFVRNI